MGLLTHNLRIIAAAGLAILILAWGSARSHALDIRIKDQATISGSKVYLGDIATFSPSENALVARLKGLEVASAPSPGNDIRLKRQFLDYKIGSMIGDDESVRLEIPNALRISRTAQEISPDQMERIFKEHVRRHVSWPAQKIVFEDIRTPGRISLPEGNLAWKVRGRGDPDYLGNVYLTVDFRVDGRSIRKASLSGTVNVKREVVRAARKIRSGELITAKDLVSNLENSDHRPGGDAVTDPEEAVGKRAVRSIREGLCITRQMIEDPPIVKKGKRVVIRAQNRWIQADTLGMVMEDGRIGDQVKVVNISSGKQILGIVRSPGLVEVHF